MSGLVVNSSGIVEFNNPALGLDPTGLKEWVLQLKETAQKTHRQLGRIFTETRSTKLVADGFVSASDPSRNYVIQVGSTSVTHLTFDGLMETFDEETNNFEDDNNIINEFIQNTTSYGISFMITVYHSDETIAAIYTRKFGRLDMTQFQNAQEDKKANRSLEKMCQRDPQVEFEKFLAYVPPQQAKKYPLSAIGE